MTDIFSKTALDSLDDHSEAEEMPRVASPQLIVVLCAMLAMLVVAIYWYAFGTINYKVVAQGVAFPFKADLQDETDIRSLPNDGREILVYVSFYDLRKLKKGQQVQVTPADLERESCGYAYGRITAIEQYPTTREAVAKRIQAPPILAVSRRAYGFDHREAQNGPYYTLKYRQLKEKLLSSHS